MFETIPVGDNPDVKEAGARQNTNTETDRVNISYFMKETARLQPYSKAVVCPAGKDKDGRAAWSHLTFLQLERLADRYAAGLDEAGISHGTRTILMVKPGIEFFGLMLGLFKVGAVPVVVDPGMGIKRMLHCLAESRASAFIGIPIANALRVLFPSYFKTVNVAVTAGKRWFWGGTTLKKIRNRPWKEYTIAETKRDELAMVAFTTGSTGPAKGVQFTHGMMEAQVKSLQSEYNVGRGEVGLHTFPVFALFDCCLGATSIVPDMDPQKPAHVNPKNVIEPILSHGVTYMFGSPALVRRVGKYGKEKGITLPTLKTVLTAGAPVQLKVLENFFSMLDEDSEIHTPYGATEALPVSSMPGSEILSEAADTNPLKSGVCVGRPVKDTEINIINLMDEAIDRWTDELLCPDGKVGEIVVKGPQVSPGYFDRPDEDKDGKIPFNDSVIHRMGDVGWVDNKDRIWVCGRKKHRVTTPDDILYTIPCESVFNLHEKVFRSALIGLGPKENQTPVICVELKRGVFFWERKRIEKELLEMAEADEMTRSIKTILFHRSFPVDIRHNAKIFREQLVLWAEKKLSGKTVASAMEHA